MLHGVGSRNKKDGGRQPGAHLWVTGGREVCQSDQTCRLIASQPARVNVRTWVFVCMLQAVCIWPAGGAILKRQHSRWPAFSMNCGGASMGLRRNCRSAALSAPWQQPERRVTATAFSMHRPRIALRQSGGESRAIRLFGANSPASEAETNTLSVHVVLPCLNEERVLPASLDRLCKFLAQQREWNWRITVVDNGSSDGTSNVTCAFARMEPRVSLMRLQEAGRGRALKQAWLNDTADVQSYMDVDLSTDLEAFPSLVRCVAEGRADMAVASRNVEGASVLRRTLLRSITSRGLSMLVRSLFWRFRVRDTQCGCKVAGREALALVLPRVRNTGWFFDTEMLLLAHSAHMSVEEVGVVWIDDRDSRVKVLATIFEMLRGLARLRLELWAQRFRAVWQQVVKVGNNTGRRVKRGGKRFVLIPLLRVANKVLTAVAGALPQDARVRIDSSGLLRAGFVEWLGLTSFANRYMPALSTLSQNMARWFLSRFDEGQLMGMISMAGTELIAREVQRQIEPLPPDVQQKAVALSERVVGQLETKLVEFGQAGWLMDSFMDTEIKRLPETLNKVLSDPWNSLPILQEPEVREAVAQILSAKAEVEARRVLSAIGLTEQQSSRFLELNAGTGNRVAAALPNASARQNTSAKLDKAAPAPGSWQQLPYPSMLAALLSSNLSSMQLSAPRNLTSSGLASYLSDLRQQDADANLSLTSAAWQATGSVSWQELWESLFASAFTPANASQAALASAPPAASNVSLLLGSEAGLNTSLVGALETVFNTSVITSSLPRVPSSSLRFLDSVDSAVAVSPASLNMLRDAFAFKLLNDALLLNESAAPDASDSGVSSANAVAKLESARLSFVAVAESASAALKTASATSSKMWGKGQGFVDEATAASLGMLRPLRASAKAFVRTRRPAPSREGEARAEGGAPDSAGERDESESARGWRHALVQWAGALVARTRPHKQRESAHSSSPDAPSSPPDTTPSPPP